VRAASRTVPPYPEIDALADQGAHRTQISTVRRTPRVYQGACQQCEWLGSKTTGDEALADMLAHTKATPRRTL
jgi:hypothetical protein